MDLAADKNLPSTSLEVSFSPSPHLPGTQVTLTVKLWSFTFAVRVDREELRQILSPGFTGRFGDAHHFGPKKIHATIVKLIR